MNYLFFDYETSGLCEKFDQIYQFAAVRTDEDLNQIGEPVNICCRPRPDILPSPAAIRTTGIDVAELQLNGLSEFEFARRVRKVLCHNETQVIVGYNIRNFDEKFTRFLFYRNFLHPYDWCWHRSNSILDLWQVMQLGFAYGRLGEIKFIGEDDDKPSLKLEDLATFNGIGHEAHDALSDVYATIELMKLVRTNNPKLLDYMDSLRQSAAVFDVINKQTFHLVDSRHGYPNGFIAPYSLVGPHPNFSNTVVAWDLRVSPSAFVEMGHEECRRLLFTKGIEKDKRPGFATIKINAAPVVMKTPPPEAFSSEVLAVIEENRRRVKELQPSLQELADNVYGQPFPEGDPDGELYAGNFFGDLDHDRPGFQKLNDDAYSVTISDFKTSRFKRLFKRLQARSFPDLLTPDQAADFRSFCAKRFLTDGEAPWRTKIEFYKEFEEAISRRDLSERQYACLERLRTYAEHLVSSVSAARHVANDSSSD